MKTQMILSTLVLLTSLNVYAEHHTSQGGHYITDKQGYTLYSYDNDKNGISNCYGQCAVSWQPYLYSAGAKIAKGWGTFRREDGTTQWTYNNKPLYKWAGDAVVGDRYGDGVGGIWHIVESGQYVGPSHNASKYESKQQAYKKPSRRKTYGGYGY